MLLLMRSLLRSLMLGPRRDRLTFSRCLLCLR